MKKRFLFGIVALIVLGYVFHVIQQNKKMAQQNEVMIQLSALLECGDEHAHAEVVWDLTPGAVAERIPIRKKSSRIAQGKASYSGVTDCRMDGRAGELIFHFSYGCLDLMQIVFEIDETAEEWFTKQVVSLRECVGQESERIGDTDGLYAGDAYTWYLDGTLLQLDRLIRNNGEMTITLSVGKR